MIRKPFAFLALTILMLFFFQLAGTLVESIYILDLLKTSLDEKALGILFFFSPLLLLPFAKRAPAWLTWLAFVLLFVARGVLPYLDTPGRMIASGIGTAAVLILLPILLAELLGEELRPRGTAPIKGLLAAQSLAMATAISILLRTFLFTLDVSLTPQYGVIGWILGILLGGALTRLSPAERVPGGEKPTGVFTASLGMMALLGLIYFAFSSPGVIARWTGGNYTFIVGGVSLMTLGWLVLSLRYPARAGQVRRGFLFVWNLLFTIALIGTILVHTVQFPATPDAPAVVVGEAGWFTALPLIITLLLFPVLFLDGAAFAEVLISRKPSPRQMAAGFFVGAVFLVLMIFANIFSNVWGYVEPVSPFFRNKFWLSYLLFCAVITWSAARLARDPETITSPKVDRSAFSVWAGSFGVIFVLTLVMAALTERPRPPVGEPNRLRVMTYNIQQANDDAGEKSFDRQLALMQEVSADLIALQESDSARISLNNNDYVRYFAARLGYYSYYGPKTVTGTFGTAVLSRYPIENPRTVFTYSDEDEIGTAVLEITVGGRRFTIYNVHPDGSDTAMMAFATNLVEAIQDDENVIALGDYNLRESEAAYQLIAEHLKNAWLAVNPTGIDANGLDMSGDRRIDHIFVSPHLEVLEAVYILPPRSATDHPAHWASIGW